MKIYENFHVKATFLHDKSNRMKTYLHIYLVSMFSGLQNFIPPETNIFAFRLFSVSVYL